MRKYSTDQIEGSSAYWEQLEAFARLGVQKLLQQVLEEEITALLGRKRSEGTVYVNVMKVKQDQIRRRGWAT